MVSLSSLLHFEVFVLEIVKSFTNASVLTLEIALGAEIADTEPKDAEAV